MLVYSFTRAFKDRKTGFGFPGSRVYGSRHVTGGTGSSDGAAESRGTTVSPDSTTEDNSRTLTVEAGGWDFAGFRIVGFRTNASL